MRVLWITNDLGPRHGGIEVFVEQLLARVHPATTLVYGPAGDAGWEEHDRRAPYRVVRADGRLLPTPRVLRRSIALAREHEADVVVLGAAWPLGELAPALGKQLGVPVVALSHGLEAGLARAGGGYLIRRATRGLAGLTTISDWTEGRLAPHVRARRMVRVAPGVDVARFEPDPDRAAMQRKRWGIPRDAPVVGCVSRLVARKGQDTLVDVWPEVHRRHPDAWLVLIGAGPMRSRLERAVDKLGPDANVLLAGPCEGDGLPDVYASLDLFVMPCRDRHGGIDVEGLGMVYLEAQAAAVPVIAGRSGGAPETVLAGSTGSVVDGRDHAALIESVDRWLRDPAGRQRAGRSGRDWVGEVWSWDAAAEGFAHLLELVVEEGS